MTVNRYYSGGGGGGGWLVMYNVLTVSSPSQR